MTVMVMLPLATLDCAKLVKSHSIQPVEGLSVRVDLVISLGEQVGVLFHVTLLSTKESQAWAETVVADVPTTLCRYKPSSIEVGVIAAGHGMALRSYSNMMLL